MSSYPLLEQLRQACFPSAPQAVSTDLPGTAVSTGSPWGGILSWIQAKATTRPRATAESQRHPENQAGLVVNENGEAELRAGHTLYDHAVGASLVLRPDGYAVLTAPAGLLLSGVLKTSAKPSQAFSFGNLRFHPDWETGRQGLLTALLPADASVLDRIYVGNKQTDKTPVTLSTFLKQEGLYGIPKNADSS